MWQTAWAKTSTKFSRQSSSMATNRLPRLRSPGKPRSGFEGSGKSEWQQENRYRPAQGPHPAYWLHPRRLQPARAQEELPHFHSRNGNAVPVHLRERRRTWTPVESGPSRFGKSDSRNRRRDCTRPPRRPEHIIIL